MYICLCKFYIFVFMCCRCNVWFGDSPVQVLPADEASYSQPQIALYAAAITIIAIVSSKHSQEKKNGGQLCAY